MPDEKELSLAGQTMQWEFDSGPTANSVYEHTFNADGTVTYKQVDAKGALSQKSDASQSDKGGRSTGAKKKPTEYASFEVGEGAHLVSYLSDMGWTLTVHVNVEDETLHGFASNDKEWHPVTGRIVG